MKVKMPINTVVPLELKKEVALLFSNWGRKRLTPLSPHTTWHTLLRTAAVSTNVSPSCLFQLIAGQDARTILSSLPSLRLASGTYATILVST